MYTMKNKIILFVLIIVCLLYFNPLTQNFYRYLDKKSNEGIVLNGCFATLIKLNSEYTYVNISPQNYDLLFSKTDVYYFVYDNVNYNCQAGYESTLNLRDSKYYCNPGPEILFKSLSDPLIDPVRINLDSNLKNLLDIVNYVGPYT